MLPTISQVCSLHSPWDKDVEEYAAGACRAIEVWLTKLETYLQAHGLDDCRRLLDAHQVATPVASFQGGLFAREEDARREHWAHFARRLELCQALGIGTLVVAADIHGPLAEQDFERTRASLAEAADRAAKHNVRLALEFHARATLANNLQTAAALVEDAGRPNLGICFDVMHYYLGPSKFEDLVLLSPENLFHVQFSDLAGQLRETATDADRVLPGDGDFALEPIVAHLHEIGYQGCVSLELMNPRLWQVPARQLGEVGMTALRKVLGQASMG
jgi:2-keto-myo-inositol isomerase